MYEYVWVYMTMHDYAWQCMTMTMYDQIIVLEYECVCFRIHITCSTLWDTVDDICYATTKTSKIEEEKNNEKDKKLNPHASISTLCLFSLELVGSSLKLSWAWHTSA